MSAPKKDDGLIKKVERLRENQQETEQDALSFRETLARPTLKKNVSSVGTYITATDYTDTTKTAKINVVANTEYTVMVKVTIGMECTSTSAGNHREFIFRLIRKDLAGNVTTLDVDSRGMILDTAIVLASSVLLVGVDTPPANSVAQYVVQVKLGASGNARVFAREEYWSVTPRIAKMGGDNVLNLV